MLGSGKRQRRRAVGDGRAGLLLNLQHPHPTQHQVGVSWSPGRLRRACVNGVCGQSGVLPATPCPTGEGERCGETGALGGRGAGTDCQEIPRKELGTSCVARSCGSWEEEEGPQDGGRLTSVPSGFPAWGRMWTHLVSGSCFACTFPGTPRLPRSQLSALWQGRGLRLGAAAPPLVPCRRCYVSGDGKRVGGVEAGAPASRRLGFHRGGAGEAEQRRAWKLRNNPPPAQPS